MASLAFVFLVAFLAVARTQGQNDKPDTSKDDPETPKDEPETPKDEPETPKDEPDTPKDEPETPKDEPETPKDEPVTPKDEPDTPKDEPDTPKNDTDPPKDTNPPGVCSCEGPICNDPLSTNPTINCTEDQDTCISVKDQFIAVGVTRSFKGCAKTNESVNGNFWFDFGRGLQLNISSKLCETTGCDTSIDDLWIRDLENGIECPRCYKFGQSSCSPNETLLCRGDLDTCITVRGAVIEGPYRIPFSGQGCATASVCDIAKKESRVLFPGRMFTLQMDKVSCSSASGLAGFTLSLLVAVLSPCLLGLLTNTFSA